MKKRIFFTPGDMALAGMFAAVTAILSQISILVQPVPFSFGVFGVMLAATILDTKLAVMSQLVYVMVGATGMPVYSGFQGGLQRLVGPTGGFLIGYIIMAFTIGIILSRKAAPSYRLALFANLAGIVACHLPGILWLSVAANLGFVKAAMAASLPYIPMDIIKAVASAAIGLKLRERLKAARAGR